MVAGVLGAYAYLGPKAGREIFNLQSEQADVTFGAVTVLTGVFGTITGGRYYTNVRRDEGQRQGNRYQGLKPHPMAIQMYWSGSYV